MTARVDHPGRADFVPAWIARAGAVAVIVVVALAAAAALPFVYVAPNRLVVGAAQSAAAILGTQAWPIAGCALLGAGLLCVPRRRWSALASVVMLSTAFLLLAAALGQAAAGLTEGQPAATRVRLASGAWTSLLMLGAAIALACRRTGRPLVGWTAAAGLLAASVALAWSGVFDGLSLAVEYRARREAVHAAIIEHLALSTGAIVLAAVTAAALYTWRRVHGLADLAINGLQVVPAVALLGGLVAATSALLAAMPALRDVGLSALGAGPAILGIAAYLLLPFWRGIGAGLRAPDPATIDAATAVGLTPRQTLLRVRLPLGAPILIGALRVASVQSIGLATLGALVGAGGLGGVVFDGMAQFALDLILLGAIPVIALSLAADLGLGLLERRARARWHA